MTEERRHKRSAKPVIDPGLSTVRAVALPSARVVANGDSAARYGDTTIEALPTLGQAENGVDRKLRGGYYTPVPIAKFLARWAIRNRRSRVLEPSAGDGELVAAAADCLDGTTPVLAVEVNENQASKLMARMGRLANVVQDDLFAWYMRHKPDGQYDAVVGNPPFIRYQDFPEEYRTSAFALMREEGLRPSRLTNAWVPFVVAATRALRVGGRLAIVVPAELMQVTYASELRAYLARKYGVLTLVTFRTLLFHGVQQETVLLLGERKDGGAAEISLEQLDDIAHLGRFDPSTLGRVTVELDHAREKWTQYYLSPYELGLIRSIESCAEFGRLGEYAEVDVGVVTGRNEFFILSAVDAKRLRLTRMCIPVVGRSAQVPGLVFSGLDWKRLAGSGTRSYLLQLGNRARESLSKEALRYVESGEAKEYHLGYKCAIRLPNWWNVPSTWIPDAFLLRQIHQGPRIIQNLSSATCTDTIHRIRAKPGVDVSWLAGASMNSLTYAFAEIRGRSYGGGVLELEPTEAEGLPFPRQTDAASGITLVIDGLDELARQGDLETAIGEVDKLVLQPAGLATKDVETLRQIWRKLSRRRVERTWG